MPLCRSGFLTRRHMSGERSKGGTSHIIISCFLRTMEPTALQCNGVDYSGTDGAITIQI